jgi:hypothetical protein
MNKNTSCQILPDFSLRTNMLLEGWVTLPRIGIVKSHWHIQEVSHMDPLRSHGEQACKPCQILIENIFLINYIYKLLYREGRKNEYALWFLSILVDPINTKGILNAIKSFMIKHTFKVDQRLSWSIAGLCFSVWEEKALNCIKIELTSDNFVHPVSVFALVTSFTPINPLTSISSIFLLVLWQTRLV